MAAELKAAFPTATFDMKPSNKGRFEVTVDGRPVFEKSKLGRHPQPGEILALLRAR